MSFLSFTVSPRMNGISCTQTDRQTRVLTRDGIDAFDEVFDVVVTHVFVLVEISPRRCDHFSAIAKLVVRTELGIQLGCNDNKNCPSDALGWPHFAPLLRGVTN